MSKWIDAIIVKMALANNRLLQGNCEYELWKQEVSKIVDAMPSIDIVRCQDCKKSHIDGKTTHYLWCTEWGRSTDTFGYCERGEREGER